MTTDLPAIVAELRALFIVALMKQGATREDAEYDATIPGIYSYEKIKGIKKFYNKAACYGRMDSEVEMVDWHARAIASDFYETLWCGLSGNVTYWTKCFKEGVLVLNNARVIGGEIIGKGPDKLTAIL